MKEQYKKLKCGCVEDLLNIAVISFCVNHQEEHDLFLNKQSGTVM